MDPYTPKQESEYPYINLAKGDPKYGQLYKVVPLAGGKEEHVFMSNPSNHSLVLEAKGDNHLASAFFANGGTLNGMDASTLTPSSSTVNTQPQTSNTGSQSPLNTGSTFTPAPSTNGDTVNSYQAIPNSPANAEVTPTPEIAGTPDPTILSTPSPNISSDKTDEKSTPVNPNINNSGNNGSTISATTNESGVPYHTVVHGDTMTNIAQANNMSQQHLESHNPQINDPNKIYPGEKVYLNTPVVVGIPPPTSKFSIGEASETTTTPTPDSVKPANLASDTDSPSISDPINHFETNGKTDLWHPSSTNPHSV